MRHKLLAFMFVVVVFVPGCDLFTNYVYVQAEYPIIKDPAPPVLVVPDDIRPGEDPKIDALIGISFRLQAHIKKLKAAIDEYNKFAREKNAEPIKKAEPDPE